MSHQPTDLELLIEKSRKVLETSRDTSGNSASSFLNDDDDDERPDSNNHDYSNMTPFDKIITADGTNSSSSSSIADDDDDDSCRSLTSLLSPSNDPQCLDPHTTPHSKSKTTGSTLSAATFGIFKGMVGPAILYLPRGFADAGYAIALGLLCLTTMMFLYSSHCLLTCWHEQMRVLETNSNRRVYSDDGGGGVETEELQSSPPRRQQHRRKGLTYPSLAHLAFGDRGEWLVMNGIALMQLGVCLTYFIFVPQNLRSSVEELTGVELPLGVYLGVMVMIQIPLSWVRDIRTLTYTNVLANALILFGLITCLYFALSTTTPLLLLSTITHLPPIGPHTFPFIGTAVLLFEGSITLCIPLQDAVDGDNPRKRYPTVYRRTILSIVIFYSLFGIVCWAAFGDEVRTVLTTSLPEGDLATGVQLCYSLAVIFTFPLQAYPAHEILVRLVLGGRATMDEGDSSKSLASGGGGSSTWRRPVLTSTVVVLLSMVASVEMDRLGHVVSLMGSLLGCPIAFVFPPLIYDTLSGEHLPGWKRFMNGTVAILGIVGMAASSFSTLMMWNSAEGGGDGGDVR